MESIIVLTRKNLHIFIEDGGIGWWRLEKERAEQCRYVICTHNSPRDPEQHRNAFFIGKISGISSSEHPDSNGLYRRCINISEYAYIETTEPIRFNKNENPVNYIKQDDLLKRINLSDLEWSEFPDSLADTEESIHLTKIEQLQHDLDEINTDASLTETERKALVATRLGQSNFRTALLSKWGERCPITDCDIPSVLRASHIQAWSDPASTNQTRLDPENGLLLAASIDALFDRHLISFTDDGYLLFSDGIEEQSGSLGIRYSSIGPLNDAQKRYMAIHRQHFYKRS